MEKRLKEKMLGSTKIPIDRKISLVKEVADLPSAREGDFVVFSLASGEKRLFEMSDLKGGDRLCSSLKPRG